MKRLRVHERTTHSVSVVIIVNILYVVLDAINTAAGDNTVSIIALTGEGEFFSSGNDLSGMLRVADPKKAMEESRPKLKAIIQAFATCPKLLICVVNGPCIGIAATLTVLCDIIYAANTVRIPNWDF